MGRDNKRTGARVTYRKYDEMVVAPTAMFDWGEPKPQCVQYGARRASVLDIGDDSWIGAGEKRGN